MTDKAKPESGTAGPSFSSVTSVLCTCGYLQRASDEPAVPIVFDAKMNEYHLQHFDLDGTGRHGVSIIFHCPRCGGAAPTSKRGTFFAHITDGESNRLRALGSGVNTMADAIAKFGEPDQDQPQGLTTQSPASDTKPSVIRSYRVLTYSGLSETAHVRFTDYGPERGVRMSLHGKYVGEPEVKPLRM